MPSYFSPLVWPTEALKGSVEQGKLRVLNPSCSERQRDAIKLQHLGPPPDARPCCMQRLGALDPGSRFQNLTALHIDALGGCRATSTNTDIDTLDERGCLDMRTYLKEQACLPLQA